MRRCALGFVLVALGCTGGVPIDESRAAIIGGTTDTGDPGVVMLLQTIPGQTSSALCTGEVISPHVVLTAAHCTGGEDPTITNATWQVFLGPDFSQATSATMLAVKEAHFNSAFDPNNLDNGNDVGVAIMQDPIPVTPLPINRGPIDASFDGKPVRFVGYGLDNAPAQSGAGVKRQTTSTINTHTDLLLNFKDPAHETCNGDSGGPAFMTINGREVIVGLTSFGDRNCSAGGSDTRVDAMLAFIDPFVRANDPGFVGTPTASVPPDMGPGAPPASQAPPSSPPSPSGGTMAPPTAPASASPPSGSEAGAVGASCHSDADCLSGLCGMNSDGSYACYPANANAAKGGCSMVDRGDDDCAAVVGLALLFALAMKLRRSSVRVRR
jgi:hypothetical protein